MGGVRSIRASGSGDKAVVVRFCRNCLVFKMRPPCYDKMQVKRAPWSQEEDAKILAHVSKHGTGNWTSVPKKAGLRRCGKSCRLRWTNYLRPELKHENFSAEEEDLIIKLHSAIGSRWAIIAQQLPGRKDNDVKNYWNKKLKKKLTEKGIDPITHRPFSQILRDYDSIGRGPSQPRIGSKDPKNVPYTGNAVSYSQVALKPEPPEGCYSLDLLAQLQSIKLITDASGCSTTRESLSLSPACFTNAGFSLPSYSLASSSSSSSTYSTAEEASQVKSLGHNFSWSEFLLDDTKLAPTEQEKTADFSTEDNDVMLNDNNNVDGQKEAGDEELIRSLCDEHFGNARLKASPSSLSSDSSFVEDMLKKDGDMFMEFPQLWEEPDY